MIKSKITPMWCAAFCLAVVIAIIPTIGAWAALIPAACGGFCLGLAVRLE